MNSVFHPHHALVLDIGGSHVTAAVVDLKLRKVLEASLSNLPVDGDAPAETLLSTWANQALRAWKQVGLVELNHIGVAMPGPFEYQTGVSRLQHKFASLYGQSVGTALTDRILPPGPQVPVLFGNDASLFALGEWWAGAARGNSRVIGVTLGTGLGGGFVESGKVRYEGSDIPPDGAIWNLPYLGGIAEDQVSAAALTRAYLTLAKQEAKPDKIALLAQQGERIAQQVYHDFGQHLANILKPVVEQFRPNCVVVGGNIARAWPLFHQPLEATLQGTRVVVSTLFDQANLLGAAALRPDEDE